MQSLISLNGLAKLAKATVDKGTPAIYGVTPLWHY